MHVGRDAGMHEQCMSAWIPGRMDGISVYAITPNACSRETFGIS